MRREIWVDSRDRMVRYSLAYINTLGYSGDNGRVLGYDSAHGWHHRHYKGEVTAVQFNNFEDTEAQFQRERIRLAGEVNDEKD